MIIGYFIFVGVKKMTKFSNSAKKHVTIDYKEKNVNTKAVNPTIIVHVA